MEPFLQVRGCVLSTVVNKQYILVFGEYHSAESQNPASVAWMANSFSDLKFLRHFCFCPFLNEKRINLKWCPTASTGRDRVLCVCVCVCGSREKFRASAGGPATSEEEWGGVERRLGRGRVYRVRFGIIWRLQNQSPNYVNIYTTWCMNWSTQN